MMTNKLKYFINKSVDNLMEDLRKDFLEYAIVERKFLGRRKYFEYYVGFYLREREFNMIFKEFSENLKSVRFFIIFFDKNYLSGGDVIFVTQKSSFRSSLLDDIVKDFLAYLKKEGKRNEILRKMKKKLNILLSENKRNFDVALYFRFYPKNLIKIKEGNINMLDMLFFKHYRIEDLF